MVRRRFPVGVQDFESIIKDGFVYVDKTEYVYDLANNYGNALFLSRPRRFGKSLLCSTPRPPLLMMHWPKLMRRTTSFLTGTTLAAR
ncbi:MAG: AAA family ATPase [Muribaculaceae bacterium]|nr:AAA family ATPase [Muribaculaceae bacterium]